MKCMKCGTIYTHLGFGYTDSEGTYNLGIRFCSPTCHYHYLKTDFKWSVWWFNIKEHMKTHQCMTCEHNEKSSRIRYLKYPICNWNDDAIIIDRIIPLTDCKFYKKEEL